MSKKKIADPELQAMVDGLKKSYGQRPGTPAMGPGFRPGHSKLGGRKPGSQNKRTRQAIEICEAMDFHPAAFLATIALTGQMPNPDGTSTPVSTEDRLRAVTALAPFVMPRLQATQVSGNPDSPLAVDTGFDINVLMGDSASVELIQALALRAAGYSDVVQMPKQLPAPERE